LISFSLSVVRDHSLIGSGVARVRQKISEIVGEGVKLETHGVLSLMSSY
jgi:hypothetical protein